MIRDPATPSPVRETGDRYQPGQRNRRRRQAPTATSHRPSAAEAERPMLTASGSFGPPRRNDDKRLHRASLARPMFTGISASSRRRPERTGGSDRFRIGSRTASVDPVCTGQAHDGTAPERLIPASQTLTRPALTGPVNEEMSWTAPSLTGPAVTGRRPLPPGRRWPP